MIQYLQELFELTSTQVFVVGLVLGSILGVVFLELWRLVSLRN